MYNNPVHHENHKGCKVEAKEMERRFARVSGLVTAEVFLGAVTLRAGGRMVAVIETTENLVAGNLTLEVCSRTVVVDGKYVKLPLLQYEILKCLLQRGGDTISLYDIFDLVWPDDQKGTGRPHRVDQHLNQLRKKLQRAGWNREIESVYKIGYRIEK